jgi:glutamate racemase
MMTNKKPIAIFDSGVGGLTILHKALDALPHEDYLYYADVANVPYGNKTKSEVKELILQAVAQMAIYDPKALVMACNTGTSAAIKELREKYDFPIVGMEPAVKPALDSKIAGKIMVMATELTLKEEKFNRLITNLMAEDQIDKIAMPELVDAAEEFNFGDQALRKLLQKKFEKIEWSQYHTVVLGCTHFIYFIPFLKDVLPKHIRIIDGNEGTINRLISLIVPQTAGHYSIECLLSGKEVDPELLFPYLNFLDKWYK